MAHSYRRHVHHHTPMLVGLGCLIFLTAFAGLNEPRPGEAWDIQGTVGVTASVVSTLTFSVSSSSCAFGTFSPDSITTCSYAATSSIANTPHGYSTTLLSPISPPTLKHGLFSVTIPAVTGSMDIGTSEYGIATSNTGPTVTVAYQSAAGCVNGSQALSAAATPISTSAQVVASSSNMAVNETTTICHKVTVERGQVPGAYSGTVTLSSILNP